MYATCLHCHGPLGANEAIEHFPTGRKLAFDGAKGRLWVVCTACRRWNLTPLEERWEAIEECERLYRGTRLRTSTDNIGLARLAEGLEIVRIGKPQKPEIAAWRYAGDFRRRWIARGVPIAVLTAAGFPIWQIVVQSTTTGRGYPFGVMLATVLAGGFALGAIKSLLSRDERARIVAADGSVATLKGESLVNVRLVPTDAGWGVQLPVGSSAEPLEGTMALHTLRSVVTARNFRGAASPAIGSALEILDEFASAEEFVRRLARASYRTGIDRHPPELALALEMAVHDDSERQALEGELRELETEWKLADEIAQIADDLFVSPDLLQRLDDLKSAGGVGLTRGSA